MEAVAAGSQPANTDVASAQSIIDQALRDLGVNPVAYAPSQNNFSLLLNFEGQTYQSVLGSYATVPDLAAQALRAIGINPISQADMTVALTATHTQAAIASLALQQLQVNLGGAGTTDGDTYSLTDVATKALIWLNIVASDETPATADATQALNWASDFHDTVVAAGSAGWASTAIPGSAVNLYAMAVGTMLAPSYEKTFDPSIYQGALAGIKAIGLGGPSAQTYAVDYVGQVHQVLLGKNLVNWAASAIPDSVAPYYALLASLEMAATFGKPFDPAAYNGAVAGIRRFSWSGANGQALAEAKVLQAHETLMARSLIDWSIGMIPTSASESYVQMAAFLLEPMLGKQPDIPSLFTQGTWDAAIERVRVIVLSGVYAVNIAAAELTQIHDALVGNGSVTWTIDTIPSSVADAYTTMLAANLAPIFGKQGDPKAVQVFGDKVTTFSMILAAPALAEQVLRGLHAEWSARGMAKWTTFDIPRELEESYVNATACRLSPQFPARFFPGGSFDPKWEELAEMMLWRVVTVPSMYQPVQCEYF